MAGAKDGPGSNTTVTMSKACSNLEEKRCMELVAIVALRLPNLINPRLKSHVSVPQRLKQNVSPVG
ncbi:hypothetical protein [Cupriavidus pauculus]|uniref:hypothetical protein n=1 Tax=Cupriavidus pauculus TaxID=82633 RepID=UPI00124567B6|nr:hypothetical protein [Cupriavidus pauculus]KAB0602730.1 hypothetical protein F7R19_11180 [Cupriavidus pauculus]MCM3606228.1 hypothetical protein [Cupriavidus pauculus]UAL02826.1 hypothetical protein K8O84_19225 [Cupriavidus pauculus]